MARSVFAKWTGRFPNLCSGEWILMVDGVNVSSYIPDDLRHSPMYTKGEYNSWSFGDHWDEHWETYEDGLDELKWIDSNKKWLETIPGVNTTTDMIMIFVSIQSEDWRHMSCGGCI